MNRKKSLTRPASVRRATSVEVARKAGVSQSAVSRTFTPGASVSPETREKVIAAANKLGYRPNVIARSLSKSRTRMIGLIMVRVSDLFYAGLLDRFTRTLQDHQYWPLVLNISDGGNVEKVLSLAMQYQVDGLITTSATLSSGLAEYCASCGVPLLIFNRFSPNMSGGTNIVRCDHFGGARLLAEELALAGHRRIAFIAGEETSSTNWERESGFQEGLAAHGLKLWARESAGGYEYQSGYEAAQRLLTARRLPDAIFAANDMMAMAVIDQARRLGLKIPEELSVAGFDGLDLAARPSYQLTTIQQPVEEMVDEAVAILMHSINDSQAEYVTRILPGRFIRGRTARLRSDLLD